jgi:hypothetical protein
MAHLSAAPAAAPFPTSETVGTSEYKGLFGYVFLDPNNPRDKYMLVDCQESLAVGEIVVIDKDGLASQITSSSCGQVGMIVATVSGSDTAAWAQIAGELSNAVVTSGVTTAAFLIAPATTDMGYLDILTSAEANVVYGGRAITAASTATSPGGLALALSDLHFSNGGAWVYGINSNHGTVS